MENLLAWIDPGLLAHANICGLDVGQPLTAWYVLQGPRVWMNVLQGHPNPAHEPRRLGVGMDRITVKMLLGSHGKVQGLVCKGLTPPTALQRQLHLRQQRHLLDRFALPPGIHEPQAAALASLGTPGLQIKLPLQISADSGSKRLHPLPPEIQNRVPLLMQLIRHRQLITQQPLATMGTEQGRVNERKVSNRCRL